MADFDIEKLRIEITLDAAGAKREARSLDVEMDKATRDRVGTVKVTTKGSKEAEAELAKVSRDRKVEIDVDVDAAKARVLTLDKQLANLLKSNQGAEAVGNIFGLIQIPAIINGLSLAAQGISALGGASVGLVSALAPLAGLTAIVPAGFLAMGQAAGVAVIAIAEVGEAVKAQNKYLTDFTTESAKAYADAMEQLGPESANFVRTLGQMRVELNTLKDVVGESFFAGLNKGVLDLKNNLGPTLTGALAGTGKALGDALGNLSTEISSPLFSRDLAQIMATNNVAISRLGSALVPVTNGLKSVSLAAGPLIMQLSTMAARSADVFAAWANAGNQSGELGAFFDRTVTVIQDLGSATGDLFSALKNVGSAAGGLGNGFLAGLEQGAANLKELTSEAGNVAKMKAYFDSLRAPLKEMNLLLKDVAAVFFNVSSQSNLADVIAQVRTEIVPVLAEFSKSTSGLFTQNLISTIAAVGKVFADLTSATGGLTLVVGVIGKMADALDRLLDFIPPLKELIGVYATLKAVSAISAFTGIGGAQGAAAIGGALGTSAKGLAAIGPQVITSIKAATAASAGLGAAQTGLAAANAAATTSFTGFRAVLGTTAGAIGAVTIALVAVAAAYEMMLKEREKIRGGFDDMVSDTENVGRLNDPGQRNIPEKLAEIDRQKQELRDAATKAWDEKWIFGAEEIGHYNAAIDRLEESANWWRSQESAMSSASGQLGVTTMSVQRFVAAQADMGVVLEGTNAIVSAYEQNLRNVSDRIDSNALALLNQKVSTDQAADAIAKYNDVNANGGLTSQQVATNARATEQAARAVTSAYRGMEQAARSLAKAQQALRDALKPASWLDMARGTHSLTAAQIEARRAAEDLNALMLQTANSAAKAATSIRTITQVQDEFTGKTYDVVKIDQTGADAGTGQSAQDRARALEDAQMRLNAANLAVIETEQQMLVLRQKGTELDPQVVSAREAVRDAEYGVEQAHQAVSDALRAQMDLYRAQREMMRENANVAQQTASAIIDAANRTAQAVRDAGGAEMEALLAKFNTLAAFQRSIPAGSPLAAVVDQVLNGLGTALARAQGDWLSNRPWGSYGNGLGFAAPGSTGARAAGGAVVLGETYRINDNGMGPEFFRPNVSGEVLTSQQMFNEMNSTDNSRSVKIDNNFYETVDPTILSRQQAWDLL